MNHDEHPRHPQKPSKNDMGVFGWETYRGRFWHLNYARASEERGRGRAGMYSRGHVAVGRSSGRSRRRRGRAQLRYRPRPACPPGPPSGRDCVFRSLGNPHHAGAFSQLEPPCGRLGDTVRTQDPPDELFDPLPPLRAPFIMMTDGLLTCLTLATFLNVLNK